MNHSELSSKIQEAEIILVGLGEEWNMTKGKNAGKLYETGKSILQQAEMEWLVPAWSEFCVRDHSAEIESALDTLTRLLEGKNYFVLSTSTNSLIEGANWREGRLVMPCGSTKRKQCSAACGETPTAVVETEQARVNSYLQYLADSISSEESIEEIASACRQFTSENELLGCCEHCGKPMYFNTVHTDCYEEKGYLEEWAVYMKWLQGTINRKLLILELGVGMQFPSVIRWPFEKVAYFNQKSHFVRVNENLYQLTEELAGRGNSVSINAIDYLNSLC